jgi:RNA-directed DNA polymerase
MYGCRESDRSIVPTKRLNNITGGGSMAEDVEGRGLAKGKTDEQTRVRTQCRRALQRALDRLRQAARRDHAKPLTALWHHVYDVNRLREAAYGENLEAHLQDLSDRLERGAYHARPVERVYIPKPDGRQRPSGIPTLEDKIVQRATVAVLNAIYEGEFRGFSSGFRPGRSPHDALDAGRWASRSATSTGCSMRTSVGAWIMHLDASFKYSRPTRGLSAQAGLSWEDLVENNL